MSTQGSVESELDDFDNKALSILVVDDDRTNRLVLNALLSKEGYKISEAADGQQAVDSCLETTPDLI
ncbi:MAG: response regulator, partial [Methylococcales bacterium]|nr:response regulator [Methylococcales bacterium]